MCVQTSSFWHTIRSLGYPTISKHWFFLAPSGQSRSVESPTLALLPHPTMPRCVPNRHVGCEAWLQAAVTSDGGCMKKGGSISNCTWIMIIFRVFRVIFDDLASHLNDVMHEISDFFELAKLVEIPSSNIWADGPKEAWVYIWRATSTWITSVRWKIWFLHTATRLATVHDVASLTESSSQGDSTPPCHKQSSPREVEGFPGFQWSTSPTTPAPSRASNSNKKSNSLKTAYEGLGARMKKRGRVTTPFSDSELSVSLTKDI